MGLRVENTFPYPTPDIDGFIVSPVDSMWEYVWWKLDIPNRLLYVDQWELTPLIDYIERIDELCCIIEARKPIKIWIYIPDDVQDTYKRFEVLKRLIPEPFREVVDTHFEWDVMNAPQGITFHE